MFLARHHELPVRLLDWTTNPLVALYNACSFEKIGDNTQNGVIWWFKKRDYAIDINVFKEQEPFNIKGIRLIYPFYPTPKMTAQSGLFTIHGYPWQDLRKIKNNDYESKDCDIDHGGRWIITRDNKDNILKELNRIGINHRTLFPGLYGLTKGIIQEEVFRKIDH